MRSAERRTARYGEWASPISAADVARGGLRLGFPSIVGDDVWWTEGRPAEGGRQVVVSAVRGDLLAPPWNARTRVHEYGGRSWLPLDETRFVFTEWTDQRLYLAEAGSDPTPITPVPSSPAALRYADFVRVTDELWCVRESHDSGRIHRDIVAIPLDGSAADDPSRIRSIVAGSDFLAYPTPNADGTRLAWIAWDHPRMPWDGTELRIATVRDGVAHGWTTVAGGATESVLQPMWTADGGLYFLSDRSGWWLPYRLDASGSIRPLVEREEEFGGPLWQLGMRFFAATQDGRLVVVHAGKLGILDPTSGDIVDLDIPANVVEPMLDAAEAYVCFIGAGPLLPPTLFRFDLRDHTCREIRRSVDVLPDVRYVPIPQRRVFQRTDGQPVHAVVYPPRNPDFSAPPEERPPYVVIAHGGPTSSSPPILRLEYAYFTSRGIGILDVDYGGSTGYGRAYRERLRGQWGVVDVEDCVAAAQSLVAAGEADGTRLAIRGASAGGWTVLCAVTRTNVFSAAVSYFGVAELVKFVTQTHDFESHYVEGLVGPLPQARDLYLERAPLSHVDDVCCPVLLIQGLEDPVVPPSQAEMFCEALAAKGIPHAYLAFEGEQHGLRRERNIVTALEAELSFYGQVFGVIPPGVPRLELSGLRRPPHHR
ncbi:MAG: S9 family peptidase [Acidothermus sp.]|nr:S9 family peptidase [Acidothermus sp.]MCL6537573.1 prolyl oligopeptidase family serine peptidase [Acidothermus sp.]